MIKRKIKIQLRSASEKLSKARDFFDSFAWLRAWRRLGHEKSKDSQSSPQELYLGLLELFLNPIWCVYLLTGISLLLAFLGARAIDGLTYGMSSALSPLSSAEVTNVLSVSIVGVMLGGFKVCIIAAKHQDWMALHPNEILFLREKRALKRVSRQTGPLPKSKSGPSSRL